MLLLLKGRDGREGEGRKLLEKEEVNISWAK
jgi:hypothetical protein